MSNRKSSCIVVLVATVSVFEELSFVILSRVIMPRSKCVSHALAYFGTCSFTCASRLESYAWIC
jgi:hypothetical protein